MPQGSILWPQVRYIMEPGIIQIMYNIEVTHDVAKDEYNAVGVLPQ